MIAVVNVQKGTSLRTLGITRSICILSKSGVPYRGHCPWGCGLCLEQRTDPRTLYSSSRTIGSSRGSTSIIDFDRQGQLSCFCQHSQVLGDGHFVRAKLSAATTVVYVNTYFIPLYFQFVQSDSALYAAVHLLPFFVCAGCSPSSLSYTSKYSRVLLTSKRSANLGLQ